MREQAEVRAEVRSRNKKSIKAGIAVHKMK
jgi:hypothetical protein